MVGFLPIQQWEITLLTPCVLFLYAKPCRNGFYSKRREYTPPVQILSIWDRPLIREAKHFYDVIFMATMLCLTGPYPYLQCLTKTLRIEGFVLSDIDYDKWIKSFEEIYKWIKEVP